MLKRAQTTDASTKVYVFNYNSNVCKRRRMGHPFSDGDNDEELEDSSTEPFLTPKSIDHAQPYGQSASMDSMAVEASQGGAGRHLSMETPRNPLFQLPRSDGGIDLAAAPSGMLRAVNPRNDQAVGYDYLGTAAAAAAAAATTFPTPAVTDAGSASPQTPMPISSPAHWNTTAMRPTNVFDYAAAPNQTIPAAAMPYPMPVRPTAMPRTSQLPGGSSSSTADLAQPLPTRSPPFHVQGANVMQPITNDRSLKVE